jgi:hypothetical protein
MHQRSNSRREEIEKVAYRIWEEGGRPRRMRTGSAQSKNLKSARPGRRDSHFRPS